MPSARGASMTPSSRRTAWWRARWSGSGKSGCGVSTRSNRNTTRGIANRRSRSPRAIDRRYWRSVRICHGFGTPQRPDQRTASRSFDWSIKEVTLDQKRRRGYVWIRIIWQTGSTSEHWFQRTVHELCAARRSGPFAPAHHRAERPAEDGWRDRRTFLMRKHSAPRMGRRSPAAWFTSCGSGGRSRPSRSTAREQTHHDGLMGPTRCRALRRPSASRHRSYSIGFEEGG